MLRPSVRRQSRKLKQNAKKSVQRSKDKLVATSCHGTSQNRKQVLKNSIHNRSLSNSHNSKLNISVHSSRVQKIPNGLIALSGYRKTSKRHLQSESILKSPIPQPKRKSRSMRLSEKEASLNLSNGARRITRSSFDTFHNTLPEKNIRQARQNFNISVKGIEKPVITLNDSDLTAADSRSSKRLITSPQSAAKSVTVKRTAIEKHPVVITEEPRRVTRSSVGSATGFSTLKNKSPKSEFVAVPIHTSSKKITNLKQTRKKSKPVITTNFKKVTRSRSGTGSTSSLHQSAEKQIKSKPTGKKRYSGVGTEFSISSIFGSATSSTSIRNKNFGHKPPTSLPIQSSRTKVVNGKGEFAAENSKRMTHSSFSNATDTSIALKNKSRISGPVSPQQRFVEKLVKTRRTAKGNFGSKLVVSPLPPQSAPKTDRSKAGTVQKVSKRKTRSSMSDHAATLEPAHDEVKKGKRKKSKESDISINTRKKMQPENLKSILATPISSTRKKSNSLHSGSSSGSHLYKNKQTLFCSKVKNFESELEGIPIDCLTYVPLSPNVSKKSYKNINSPLIKLKNTAEHQLNAEKGKNSGQSKISKGAKRKTKVSPHIEGKRKRESSLTAPVSLEDPTLSIDCLTDRVSSKRPRRHTVDVLLKSKGAKTVSTTQQKRKKSSIKGTKTTPKSASISRTDLSSRLTPDTSLLPVDSISTFMSKRPNSAPAAIKRLSILKGSNSTIPKKGTLKRKRWMFNALKEKNECYEDDIFENQKFATPFRIPLEPDDESDTSIATPKFGFLCTPALPTKMPKYKDIISPTELLIARKTAEEYLYRRRNRKRTSSNSTLKTPSSAQSNFSASFDQVPEKKKLEFAEAMDQIQAIQKGLEKQNQEDSGEEDAYFSDVST